MTALKEKKKKKKDCTAFECSLSSGMNVNIERSCLPSHRVSSTRPVLRSHRKFRVALWQLASLT